MIRHFAMAAVLAGLALGAPLSAQDAGGSGPPDQFDYTPDETISDLENEGYQLVLAGDMEAARPIFRAIFDHYRERRGDDNPYTIFAALDYARVLVALEKYEEAEGFFVTGLTKAREVVGERSPDTLSALHDYANLLARRGNYQAAADMFGVATRLRREVLGDWDRETLSSMTNQANALLELGRYEEAEPLAKEALDGIVDLYWEDHPETLESLTIYSSVLSALGKLEEAEPYYLLAIRISRSLGERHAFMPRVLNNYAVLLMNMSRPEEAEPYAAEAVRISRDFYSETHRTTLFARSAYAQVLQMLQREDEALPLLKQNYNILIDTLGERHPVTLTATQNYAGGLIEVGRAEEAVPLLEKTLRIRQEEFGEDHPDTLSSMSAYAISLTYIDRDEEAEPIFATLVGKLTEILGPRHPNTLRTQNNLGSVRSKLGRVAEAEVIYRETLPVVRELYGDRSLVTLTMQRLHAIALLDLGQPEPALALTRGVVDELRERRTQQAAGGVEADSQSGREASGQRRNERLFANMLWANRVGSKDDGGLRTEAFTALQLATAGSASRAVTEAAAARFASGQGLGELVEERQELIRQWVVADEALVAAVAGGADQSSQRSTLRTQLDVFELRLAELEAQLAAEAPQYFAILRQQAVDLDELRGVLGENEAVLFLVPTDRGTHSMAVTSEGIEWARADADLEAIAERVAYLRTGLEIDGEAEFLPYFDLEAAHSLYIDLIAPVEGALAGKSRIYVIADGALSRLPLGTLVTEPVAEDADPEDMEVLREAPWLADKYALVQLPSVQSLVYIRSFGVDADGVGEAAYAGFGAPVLGGAARTRGARSATIDPVDASRLVGEVRAGTGLALMNPEALRKLSSLPGTKGELEQVRDALGSDSARLWLDTAMTEPAIREADLSSTSILHLATHGFTSEEAGGLAEPGLIFTPPTEASLEDDGYLAASEVVALDLALARWVILSACNTASPSGRPGETGLSGLAQAFFYAGAESLLVSHWPVFDDIAPILTVEALRLSEEGMPRAEALQAAMRSVRMNPDLDAAHPAVWAPFALVGEGR